VVSFLDFSREYNFYSDGGMRKTIRELKGMNNKRCKYQTSDHDARQDNKGK